MPALPSVAKVLQLSFGTVNSAKGYKDINRIHFSYTGTAPTSVLLNNFAAIALTAFGAALDGAMSTNNVITSLDVVDLSSPTAGVGVANDTIVGTLTGAAVPGDSCVVMSAKIARRYRGGHPRSYLPLGDVTKMADDDTWTTLWLGTVLTAWNGFITAVEGAGWTGAGTLAPVNVSYYEGFTNVTPVGKRAYSVPTLRVGGPLVDPIVDYIARPKIGTQRKRLGR